MSARLRFALPVALVLGLLAAQPARAQDIAASTAPAVTAPSVAPATSAAPAIDAAVVGVRHQASTETTALPQRRGNAPGVALMIVGGAALLVGLVIGDDVGSAIAVGGAVVGLYGLYQYLQ